MLKCKTYGDICSDKELNVVRAWATKDMYEVMV
jgi:hypothetical protein